MDSDHNEASNKRQRVETNDGDNNHYEGFSLQDQDCVIPVVDEKDVNSKLVFRDFVAKRRPCVIDTLPSVAATGERLKLKVEDVVKVAGDEIVQVERRLDKLEQYGQNRTQERQVEMKLSELCQKLCDEDGNFLYLSTQDSEEQFSTPCNQLLKAHSIDPSLDWAGHLQVHTCNLWLGRSNQGSSSGLHHDHHDNFYLLLEGTKTFRLFSPDAAGQMQTYGEIDQIHANGLISYVGNEVKPDGAPASEASEDGGLELKEGDASDEDSEEEVVLGKGFDYESEDEGVDVGGHTSNEDDFEILVASKPEEANDARPNNFSGIDLCGRPLSEVCKTIHEISGLNEGVVELKAGQVLYLPAGWFHEVTSTSAEGGYHMALNYWYHPPDALDSFDCPYTDISWLNPPVPKVE